jgi:hypothetical protein
MASLKIKENKEPLVEQMGKLSISKSQVLIPTQEERTLKQVQNLIATIN